MTQIDSLDPADRSYERKFNDPWYYVGFGRFTLYLKDEHMAHFFEIIFLHHYMDITRKNTIPIILPHRKAARQSGEPQIHYFFRVLLTGCTPLLFFNTCYCTQKSDSSLHTFWRSAIILRIGALAQLGERKVRNLEVRGSIPLCSTK